jgi:ribosomal protein S18 acetylase RimI-like enzyme
MAVYSSLILYLAISYVLQIADGLSLAPTPRIQVRPALRQDVPQVAELMVAAFEPRFRWFKFPERSLRKKKYLSAIGARIISTDDVYHQCWVAEEIATRQIVAFTEVGMLPSPSPYANRTPSSESESSNCEDVPYIANLCVASAFQRQGIAQSLIVVASDWAGQLMFDEIFCTVDCENLAARGLYERCNFNLVPPLEGAPTRKKLFYVKRTNCLWAPLS